MITLIALPQSPYCAKVRATLIYKGLAFTEQEPEGGSYHTTEFHRRVPAGLIPAIKIDDWVLHDSQAIMEYLQEIVPMPSIWSQDSQKRAQQRALVNYHDSKLEPAIRQLIPLAKQGMSERRTLEIGLVRDKIFDRLYRLDNMIAQIQNSSDEPVCAVDWVFPPTIQMGLDLLQYLDQSLMLPPALSLWHEDRKQQNIIQDEVIRIQGAIQQWLRKDDTVLN